MKHWLRRIRGALGLGLVWAIGGAAIGGLIELVLNILPGSDLLLGVDMWPQLLAIPGFAGGIFFAIVLGIAGARHRFSELSIKRFATWGTIAGVLFSGFLLATGFMQPMIPQFWLRAVTFIVPLTLLSAGGATASLAIAKWGERRQLPTRSQELIEGDT